MKDLRPALSPGMLPLFDYAALGDAEVERKAREAADKIQAMQRAAVVDIGRELLAMKEALPFGQFLPWVESFGLGRRTAVNYMQAAAAFGGKWETVAHLPAAVVYKLAAPSTPPAVREAVLNLRPGEVVTSQGVRSAIDAVKEAEIRKDRRDRRAEIKQEQEEHRAKWEARDAKDRAEREKVRLATEAVAERVKALLADVVPDLSEILNEIEPFTFGQLVREMVAAYRGENGIGNRGRAQ